MISDVEKHGGKKYWDRLFVSDFLLADN